MTLSDEKQLWKTRYATASRLYMSSDVGSITEKKAFNAILTITKKLERLEKDERNNKNTHTG